MSHSARITCPSCTLCCPCLRLSLPKGDRRSLVVQKWRIRRRRWAVITDRPDVRSPCISQVRDTPTRIAPPLTVLDPLAAAGAMVFDCRPQVLPGAMDVSGLELSEICSTMRASAATSPPPEREQSFGGGGGGGTYWDRYAQSWV